MHVKSEGNLRTCRDCGGDVSVHANACPHCGSSFRARHSVFYYVFWGVVSLFVIIFMIGVGLAVVTVGLPAFFAGRQTAVLKAEDGKQAPAAAFSETSEADSSSSSTNAPGASNKISRFQPLTQKEIDAAKIWLNAAHKYRDEIKQSTSYGPKYAAEDWDTCVFLYVQKQDNATKPNLRLVFRHKASNALFLKSFQIRADDVLLTLVPTSDPKRDYVSGKVRESVNVPASEHWDAILAMMKSKRVIVRYEGSATYNDHQMLDSERQCMTGMLLIYRYLGGD